jgi:glutathione synthase/RimK-type ligase-like ATP-grasp enzyme
MTVSNALVIVDSLKDWPLKFKGAELVTARKYLTSPQWAEVKGARVFNLCRSYRYQSVGYYVSLLAEARRHKPVPGITTIQDVKSPSMVRAASEELEDVIQKSLGRLKSEDFVLSVYFGRNLAKQYNKLSHRLFSLFRVPFLRVIFGHSSKSNKWFIKSISPLAVSEIPDEHRDFVLQAAEEFFLRQRGPYRRRKAARYDLAILVSQEGEPEPPSNPEALQRFVRAAEALGINAELIDRSDAGRIAEFDALFIRETTSVNHHTYRLARRAAAEGIVVVDDPESILKCTNKVYLAELLERNRIPVPRTVVVHRDNLKGLPDQLGFPLILKKPDSSFSQGVVKIETVEELASWGEKMLSRSELIIAQEFLPTAFDWRVGVFDRQPLFACKYFMASEHWQIIKRDSQGTKTEDGNAETLNVEHAPRQVIRAANLIGDGFYGVDLKQVSGKVYVIEVNDNPNIDEGVEDLVLGDMLYRSIMETFLSRIERRTGGRS